MAKLTSLLGVDSKSLQLMVDMSLDMFNVPKWKSLLDWGLPQIGLSYKSVIGAARVEAMASVIDRNSAFPLRSRGAIHTLEGEIPAIGQMFKLDEVTYRTYMQIKATPMSDEARKNAMLDILFNDIKKAGNAPHMRLDYMVYQMLSNAAIEVTLASNPDGPISASIDLLMPSGNKYQAIADTWATKATADPIRDIEKIVNDFKAKGVILSTMLMDNSAFNYMKQSTELVKFLYGKVAANTNQITSLNRVNEFLGNENLPTIQIVNSTVGIESDGVIATATPWKTGQVTFLPAGKVGTMHNAFAIESLEPVEKVAYATFDKVLISKWHDNQPWGEYTACELNAFPSWENIDQCALLDTTSKGGSY